MSYFAVDRASLLLQTSVKTNGTGAGSSLVGAQLLKSGKYADLTIKCDGKAFQVHKSFVCTQSKVLATAAEGGFLESNTGIIELNHDELPIIERMIDFLYTGSYSTDAMPGDESKETLLNHTKVYIIANKYDIQELKLVAAFKFGESLIALSKLPGPALGSSTYIPALRLMYDETPESDRILKDSAVKFAVEQAKKLVGVEGFAKFCRENGEFGFDLLKTWNGAEFKCQNCGRDEFVGELSDSDNSLKCDHCQEMVNFRPRVEGRLEIYKLRAQYRD